MTFAERLTEIMAFRGVNKTDLAKAIGVSSQAAGQWALGGNGPVVAKLDNIAAYLGVSVADLFQPVGSSFGEQRERDAQLAGKHIHEVEQIRLIELWERMPINLRRTLMKVAIDLADDSSRATHDA